MEKIFKYQLLLGDYISYERGTDAIDIRSGYVISINNTHYTIIDLDNSVVYFEQIKDIEIVSTELKTIVIRSIAASNIKISRKLKCSSTYICNNLCKGLREFPDSCSICPLGLIDNRYRTYLPGDRLYNGRIITSASFLSNTSLINKIIYTPTNGVYRTILDMLSGSLPKPDYPLIDRSIEGVKEILNNPEKYRLYERIYYNIYTTNLSNIDKFIQLEVTEIVSYRVISNTYFYINPSKSPCNYCIYDEDTCNKLGCKLKEFSKSSHNKII